MSKKTNEFVAKSIRTNVLLSTRNDVGENMESREAASLTVDDIVLKLDTNFERGLSSVEVERRRSLHNGFNEMNMKKDEPLWLKYLEQVYAYRKLHLTLSSFGFPSILCLSWAASVQRSSYCSLASVSSH